jgi:hypothetical protein
VMVRHGFGGGGVFKKTYLSYRDYQNVVLGLFATLVIEMYL